MTRKTLAYGFGLAAVVTWLGDLYLFYYELNSNSTHCQPSLGKIYPLYNHGQIAYIDFDERWTLNGLYLLAFLLFAVGFIIQRWKRAEMK